MDERKRERQRIANRKWRAAHPEEVKRRNHAYKISHRAELREKERIYWSNHKELKSSKDARSHAKHREERLAQQRIYNSTRRQEAIERVQLWRAANRAHCNTINANRRAREAGAAGSHTVTEWENLMRLCGYRCKGCDKSEPEITLTRDHIIPLARGGSNYISNIQPLCGRCNCVKHAKMPALSA